MKFAEQQPSSRAPSDWFTGDVWWDVIHAGQEPSRMRADMVRFSPGARTNWHSHVLGQALHVVSGVTLIGPRDGTISEAHLGRAGHRPAVQRPAHPRAAARRLLIPPATGRGRSVP